MAQYRIKLDNNYLGFYDYEKKKFTELVCEDVNEAIETKMYLQKKNKDRKVDYEVIYVEKPTVKQKDTIREYKKWFGDRCKSIDINTCSRQEAQAWIDKYKDSYWMQQENYKATGIKEG